MVRFKLNRFMSGYRGAVVALGAVIGGAGFGAPPEHPPRKMPLVIEEQGTKAFGGKVLGDPSMASLHCDHGYVEWQVPQNTGRRLPLLMWHSSSTKTWETPTPAGHEGFNNLLLRRGFPVYIVDVAPSGRAAQSCEPSTYAPRVDRDQVAFNNYRLGVWTPPAPPKAFPNVQFPASDPVALNQFFRANYPEIETPQNINLQSDEVVELLKEMGPTVLLTHSGSGIRGWWTAIKSENVKAIVSYEPGQFLFPEGEVPPPIPRADGVALQVPNPLMGAVIPLADFLKLTKIPIQIVIGDNIPSKLESGNVGLRLVGDTHRVRTINSKLFAEAINRHGGNAEVFVLPEHGIFGNTHFPMWDLNNQQIADLLVGFLNKQKIEKGQAIQRVTTSRKRH